MIRFEFVSIRPDRPIKPPVCSPGLVRSGARSSSHRGRSSGRQLQQAGRNGEPPREEAAAAECAGFLQVGFCHPHRRGSAAPGLLLDHRRVMRMCNGDQAVERSKGTTFGEGSELSYGFNWALAGRGVLVKDKAFYNLKSSELQNHGAKPIDCLSGLPIHFRGNAVGGASKISKSQFARLLKQVTSHISSISSVFVQDGAIGSSSKCDAKVRVISDSPSAALSLSNIIWKTTTRAVSHDSSPLTVYVATSISPGTGEILGLGSQVNNGFLAVDIERLSLIMCGKAFADVRGVKDALAALAAPVISARGGLPVSARYDLCPFLSLSFVTNVQLIIQFHDLLSVLAFGDSLILLFSSENTVKSCTELHKNVMSADGGVVLSSYGVAPFFQTGDVGAPTLLKKTASLIIASADSSGVLPPITKLSPGQAAYHFLAGYQDGKFVTTYSSSPSPILPLELAKALLTHLEDSGVPSFLVNVSDRGKHISGEDLLKLVKSTLSGNVPDRSLGVVTDPKVGDLKGKYRSFLSSKFQEIPQEFVAHALKLCEELLNRDLQQTITLIGGWRGIPVQYYNMFCRCSLLMVPLPSSAHCTDLQGSPSSF
ncbi:hypothetical protein Taro_044158 [Colocasia esculenta]|uniref:phosphoenolpyruvate carboxykinase (ATP) n=1 Tax=Colocasia esculenta TaxID=4460 RepID=A0A843X531_COLES|nr:hypothetical protein [Colocasia esculenta]